MVWMPPDVYSFLLEPVRPYTLLRGRSWGIILGEHLLKPFPQQGCMGDRGRISRARRSVENAFDVSSTRFPIFRKELAIINVRPEGTREFVLSLYSCPPQHASHQVRSISTKTWNIGSHQERGDENFEAHMEDNDRSSNGEKFFCLYMRNVKERLVDY